MSLATAAAGKQAKTKASKRLDERRPLAMAA
jgi:hypothetical protein